MHRTALLCLVTACGASSLNEKQGPRGLSADQHLAIASREDDRANELTHWPDSRSGDAAADQHVIGAWFGTWDTVAEHSRLAMAHRSAAIEAEYEQACGDTPAAVASVSPLQRYGVGSSPVPGGTLMLLSVEAGPPDKLLSAMRCHRAWMMLGRANMDDCPLDMVGVRVDAQGHDDAVELTITVADPSLVDELRRRAAHDLEAGQTRRSAVH
jgi:hypothetical protein